MIAGWSLTYWSVVTGVMYRCESRWLGNARVGAPLKFAAYQYDWKDPRLLVRWK